MNVAETILAQLGGSKFLVMTGARSLVSENNALRFKLGRGAKMPGSEMSVNWVRITLEVDDTYTMQFGFAHGLNLVIHKTVDHVHADQLRVVFTQYTGLDTSL